MKIRDRSHETGEIISRLDVHRAGCHPSQPRGLEKIPTGQPRLEDAHVKIEERMRAVALGGALGSTETGQEVCLEADSLTHEVSVSRWLCHTG